MTNVTGKDFRSEGGRLVSVDGRDLPLMGVELKAEAGGGVARVTLVQHFRNPYQEPLHVTYQVPMPTDGAVAGYAFRIGERRVVGEVDRLRMARERFERAIVEGHTAALLTQERSSLFTQELGNVPPGERITVELSVDQRLRWLSEGMWEWRFPTVVPPRYLGSQGRVQDAERVDVEVADRATGIGATLELVIGDAIADGRRPESPSHTVSFAQVAGQTSARISEGVALDRDVVVRWPVGSLEPGVSVRVGRPAKSDHGFALLTLVPPAIDTGRLPRDLVVLLDVSGSMSGPPMDRAKKVVGQLIETLDERDSVELIAFSDRPYRWKKEAVPVTEKMKRAATDWVMALSAGGGTEMKSGVEEAIRPLRGDAQRQVILVTDGHIGFEAEIVRELIEHLPAASRLHTIGVGSSVNRALTGAAARAGRGVEILVGLEEDSERGAARLVAATRAPVLVELRVSGDAVIDSAPRAVADLMGGAPVLMSLRLRPQGGSVILSGRTPHGPYSKTLQIPAISAGEGSPAIAALYAREKVEDLEMSLNGGMARAEIDPQVEQLGLEFQIATRLTSWIAVSAEQTVDPTLPTRRESVPQALPHGMSVGGLGLRGAPPVAVQGRMMPMAAAPSPAYAASAGAPPPPPRAAKMMKKEAFSLDEGAPERRRSIGGRPDAAAEKADKKEAPRMEPLAPRESEAVYDAPAAEEEPSAQGPKGGRSEEVDSDALPAKLPGAPSPIRDRSQDAESGALPAQKPGAPAPTRDRSKAADSDALSAPKPSAPPPPKGRGADTVFLKGRRLSSADGTITLEIEADAMEWDPDAAFEAELEDGTRVKVAVDAKKSTRKSKVNAGTLLRLTFSAPSLRVTSVDFVSNGVRYRVGL